MRVSRMPRVRRSCLLVGRLIGLLVVGVGAVALALSTRGFLRSPGRRRFTIITIVAAVSAFIAPSAGAWSSGYAALGGLNSNASSCLDVVGGATGNGAQVQEWGCWNTPGQQWQLAATSVPGYYEIVNQGSGKCLDVPNGAYNPGTRLQQWGCSGDGQQLWLPVPYNNGEYYSLVNYLTGKCADIAGSATTNGTAVQEWDCWNTSGQQWHGSSLSGAFTNSITPTGKTLVFDDEFNTVGPLDSNWHGLSGAQWGGQQCFVPDSNHLSQAWGVAALTATYNSPTPCSPSDPNPYESGGAESGFSYHYGVAEARVEVPCQSTTGMWPAWWSYHDVGGNNGTGEIDTMEMMAGQGQRYPDSYYVEQSLHATNTSNNQLWSATTRTGNPNLEPFCNTFHVFESVWGPGYVEFFVDGVDAGGFTARDLPSGWSASFDSYPEQLQLWLQAGAYGGTVNNGSLPQSMLVDWVRVYQ